jgi:NhaA family Na+:H+ antiporter
MAPPSSLPPEARAPAQRFRENVLRPLQRFLHVEAASGVVLVVAALIALAWANSPWAAIYFRIWDTTPSIGIESPAFTASSHFLINEGLMTVFFFAVGLEVRREIHEGELADARRAALPVAAALGGMVVPALIYLSVAPTPQARFGWGVPMATDIAFAVGVLALLGTRVPPALRVLLLALAIIDDIGAILVITFFYSSGIAWTGLLVSGAGVLGVLGLRWFRVRHAAVYMLPGAIVWGGLLTAGIHPTISGVMLGMLTPVRPLLEEDSDTGDVAHRETPPPAVRIQAALHPWVAFGIMPLFALANAGVRLGGSAVSDPVSSGVVVGAALGLVVGKPLGILAAAFITVRLGLCVLPRGVRWSGVLVVGVVAGIGFTMAIFIAGLAFQDDTLLSAAKLGVLVASGCSAVLGLALGRLLLPKRPLPMAAMTLEEAEAPAGI